MDGIFVDRPGRPNEEASARPMEGRREVPGIHPTAIIHPKAVLGENVSVGPYSVIEADTSIGDNTEIRTHVNIRGPTTIGRNNLIYSHASIGEDPQDKKYSFQGPSALEIGDGNVIREFATINRGTPLGSGVTRIGNGNWILAYCHIAHDCTVGDETVLANCTTLGGHVTVAARAYLGGFTAVHPFCSVGELAHTGGHTMIAQDVPPFVIAAGNRVRLAGVNKIGMERHQFSKQEIQHMQSAYKIFFRGGLSAAEALERLKNEFTDSEVVGKFVAFVLNSERGICR